MWATWSTPLTHLLRPSTSSTSYAGRPTGILARQGRKAFQHTATKSRPSIYGGCAILSNIAGAIVVQIALCRAPLLEWRIAAVGRWWRRSRGSGSPSSDLGGPGFYVRQANVARLARSRVAPP